MACEAGARPDAQERIAGAAGDEVLVARQPILDADLGTAGYELLFRSGDIREVGPSAATAQVVVTALGEIGLERLVEGRRAFVNVTGAFLSEIDPLPFPPEPVVLELLDTGDPSPALVARLRQLAARGYRIALDRFAWRPALEPLVELAAIVKLDMEELGPDRLVAEVERLRGRDVLLCAERVETREQFDRCRALGMDLFQGHFFRMPDEILGPRLQSSSGTRLRAAAELAHPESGLEGLERVLSLDVALSYRFLRFLNSPFVGLGHRVSSLRQALVLIGEREARQWTMLMLLSDTGECPEGLLESALVRARMCELAGRRLGDGDTTGHFVAGLFSVADALLGMPLDEVVEALPLTPEIGLALAGREGRLGELLDAVVRFETGAAEPVEAFGVRLAPLYIEALGWADGALRGALRAA